MALKNTYARLPVGRYIQKIQEELIGAGAVGIQQEFELGRVVSLSFLLDFNGKKVSFKLPINWKKVQQVLKNEGIAKANNDDHAYRVSWAILNDWIEAQMAILASETVTMPQLFLPYAMSADGKTLFEKVENSKLLLN